MSIISHNVAYWGDPIAAEAARLGLDPAWLHAIAKAEVGAIEHPGLGAPVIRFEVHTYLRKVGTSNVVQLRDAPSLWHKDAHWYQDDPEATFERVHSGSQSDEWGALIRCMEEDPVEAWNNASYGIGQLMGWHHELLGYKSGRAMVGAAMRGGVPKQIEQWGKYIERDKDGEMLAAIQAGNVEQFVTYYNGSGQVDYYSNAIRKGYDEAVQVLANPPQPEEDIEHLYDEYTERQQALTDLGYGDYLLPWGVDGSWGQASIRATKAFQSDHGLNPDGKWGKYTMEHVHNALHG